MFRSFVLAQLAAILGTVVGTAVVMAACVTMPSTDWVWSGPILGACVGAYTGRRLGARAGVPTGLLGGFTGAAIGGFFAGASGEIWSGVQWAYLGLGYGLVWGIPAALVVGAIVTGFVCLFQKAT